VKKWGLAPSTGTLAPPPAYGYERGSILLETAAQGTPQPPPMSDPQESDGSSTRPLAGSSPSSRARRHRSRRPDASSPSSSTPPPLASSSSQPLHYPQPRPASSSSSGSSGRRGHRSRDDEVEDYVPHNPPTPNVLDISLHSLSPFGQRTEEDDDLEYQEPPRTPSPPAYEPINPHVRWSYTLPPRILPLSIC
jgi:hypothetical protein